MTEARRLDVQLLPVGGGAPADPEAGLPLGEPDVVGAGPPPRGWSLQRVLFIWVFPLLRRTATAGRLEPADLFALAPEVYPEPLYGAFVAEWRSLLRASAGTGRRPRRGRTLLRVLARVHFPTMWRLWLGRAIQSLLEFSFPYFLNVLIRFVAEEKSSTWDGLAFTVLFLLVQICTVLLDNNVSMGLQSVGLRIRSSMITAIFRKVLILRQDALLGFSSGRLNNMITTDVDKAKRAVRFIHLLLTAPLKLIIALFSLYRLVGVSVFIGLGWMGTVILLNPALMYLVSKLEDKQQSKTDERVRKATETISAIQVVKCYAWEEAARAKVEEARTAELLAMWHLYCLHTVFEGLWTSVVPITTAIMFASYSLLNPHAPLTAAQAFTAMALLDMVQQPLFTIPWVLNLIVEALVAAKRLERLFFLPEAQLPATVSVGSFCLGAAPADGSSEASGEPAKASEAAICFEGETFEWPRSRDLGAAEEDTRAEEEAPEEAGTDFRLSGLALQVPNGALVAVVGATASGKTSLLQAILGEMPLARDSTSSSRCLPVLRHKPIAFAPQQPWIFNATVRQNILFGEAFSERRYSECLRCCDLEKDLALLKAGDQTKVGEKGISLSGGQKARVCLARAAYRQHISNLFLLDDPYSALDAHVARKVHEEAVLGLLAKKTRVVVTNRLEFVIGCDLVVVLDGGRIEAMGQYEDVCRRSATLRNLLTAQGLAVSSGPEDVQPGAALAAAPQFSRAFSATSATSEEGAAGEQREAGPQEEEEEARASGQIKKEVILYYLRNMGGPSTVGLLASLYITAEVIQLALPLWVAHWTSSPRESNHLSQYLSVYVFLSLFSVFFATASQMAGNVFGFRAARSIHAAMFASVLRAPMSFFQDTPQGRIINRFSKDTSEIDKDLVWQLIYTIVPVLSVLGSFMLVGSLAYFALLAFLPAIGLYYQCWKFYNRAALDLKRISKVTSSPVYDHFNNLCRENAVSIVRAHGQVERQCRTNNELIAEQQRPEYSQIYVEMWFCVCVQSLGCVLVFLVAIFAALGRGRLITASSAALALTFAGECSGSIQSLIGQIAEFGMAFNCVERVMEYATGLPAEAALLTERRPPPGWPAAGVLEVEGLRLRYRAGLPLVLKGISFSTKAGDRVGVVGRTGAGKSSLLLAMLRIAEPEPGSKISIDGEDILALGLRDLRAGVAMIPQEPVLFQESLRYNCDPYGEHSAAAVWAALEEAQLAPWVRERAEGGAGSSASPSREGTPPTTATGLDQGGADLQAITPPGGLDEMLRLEIKEGGQNLSAGQRQMVAIARAVLRKSRLVVLDEATAAIDAATDAAIQLAVRRCFHGATTLTIAHRLQTILDSDRVLVLADGEVAELGAPGELLAREAGIFRGMVEEARQ